MPSDKLAAWSLSFAVHAVSLAMQALSLAMHAVSLAVHRFSQAEHVASERACTVRVAARSVGVTDELDDIAAYLHRLTAVRHVLADSGHSPYKPFAFASAGGAAGQQRRDSTNERSLREDAMEVSRATTDRAFLVGAKSRAGECARPETHAALPITRC